MDIQGRLEASGDGSALVAQTWPDAAASPLRQTGRIELM